MKKSENTWKEGFNLQMRGVKLLNEFCPGRFKVMILRQAVETAAPYVGIYLSALIINELAGLRRPEELWRLVLISLASAAAIGILTTLVRHWDEYHRDTRYERITNIFADKLLSMDYADTDSAEHRAKLNQIKENRNWSMWGIEIAELITNEFFAGIFGIISAAVLTVTLFTSRMPAETAGKLVTLNNPLFVVAIIAALTLTAFLGPACKNKSNAYFTKFTEETKFGNRVGRFSFVASDGTKAADVRMYNQQKITRHYLEYDNTFYPGGVISKCAVGPMGLWQALGSCISAVLTGFIYLFVCLKAWGGAFGVGSVTQYVGAVTALSANLGSLIWAFGNIKNNMPFMQNVFEFLDVPNKMYKGSLTTEKRADRQYDVEFRDVSFKYPDSDLWALRHVNMKFKVGSRLAVVGENGSGKTTFIKLLCRLYDPTEGEILLNGIDIRKYNYDDYMSIFSVVFQDFELLSQPLGDNVAGSMNYDKDRVLKALNDAGFGERLKTMPKGLDTCIYKDFSKDGVDVSGGEAQKIAIARALYKDAPFIILDEPTAALDPIAEAEIYSKFNEISGDRTAIYISHRLSSCKFCDEIAVFDKGSVVQKGSHEQLLSDENGKYYALWNAQAQYYTEKK